MTPNPFTVAVRGTTQLAATGTFSGDGLKLDVTSEVTWSTSSRKTATVSRNGARPGRRRGAVNITAKKGNKQNQAAGTVNWRFPLCSGVVDAHRPPSLRPRGAKPRPTP